jgi:hypothetical protein
MKLKKINFVSQLLILLLAGLVMGLMLQMAQAQTQTQGQTPQVLQTELPQKSLGDTIRQNTTLGYYHQFLGPTVGGTGGETYSPFLEGRSPYQSFHAANLSYKMNPDWSIGVSIAAANAYGDTASNQRSSDPDNRDDVLRDEFFNARINLGLPTLKTDLGTLFTTISYEHPTSNVAKQDNMKFGGVLAQSFAIKLPNIKYTAGVMWQYYRVAFDKNVDNYPANHLFSGSTPYSVAKRTTIVSGGPYVTYRHNDNWGMNSSLALDWDQLGDQAGTSSYNNNLPHRARVGVTYFPSKLKQISSVGLFTQGLVKYTTNTHAVGAEFALKF